MVEVRDEQMRGSCTEQRGETIWQKEEEMIPQLEVVFNR